MRGVESALTFILFFVLMVGLFYMTSLAMFTYMATTDAVHKRIMLRDLEQRSIGYTGVCDGNYVDVYYEGGVPEYAVRLLCVDYNAADWCIVPLKGGGVVVDQMFPAVNPLQRPFLEYNLLACGSTWPGKCGAIVCYALGTRRAYPFVPT